MQLPACDYLDAAGIPYERRAFPTTTKKGAANVAAALGCEAGRMVKTLIFQSGTGERVLVMVGGDKNAISGHLKRAIGNRNIKMASLEAVRQTTGYQVGSVPPFHWQPSGFRSFLDHQLTSYDILGVGAGEWGEEILITPANLARASGAVIVNLTDREQPATVGSAPSARTV